MSGIRFLVAEDDFGSRVMMKKLLSEYGDVDLAVDGEDAVRAFSAALAEGRPYGVVLLDIMMPRMDGHQALREIRRLEAWEQKDGHEGVAVIMATVLEDPRSVIDSYFDGGADAYLVKPIDRQKVRSELGRLGITPVGRGNP